jgi:hypothetical protein
MNLNALENMKKTNCTLGTAVEHSFTLSSDKNAAKVQALEYKVKLEEELKFTQDVIMEISRELETQFKLYNL